MPLAAAKNIKISPNGSLSGIEEPSPGKQIEEGSAQLSDKDQETGDVPGKTTDLYNTGLRMR